MSNGKMRQRIAAEAARLLYDRQESKLYRARLRAARRLAPGQFAPHQLPTNREIQAELVALAQGMAREAPAPAHAPQTATSRRSQAASQDRFRVYEQLLLPLELVKQPRHLHPEGDALYHSLQVFMLAQEALPYDEEFLLAALLHDVGKAIDPQDPVAAGLEALAGQITPRTQWLISHLEQAHELREGRLGARARRRLEESEHFEELTLLAQCDREGRAVGVRVPEISEALQYLRKLADACGDG